MNDYLDTTREHAAEFGADWAGKYDDYVSRESGPPWTDEEWRAFAGHQWVERRVVLVQGRLFCDLMNIFHPRELREAQSISESWASRGVVARIVYRDNEEHHGAYVSDEMAAQCRDWFVGWKK